MKVVKRFGLFWYEFVVGDDWTVAVGVAAALGATYALLRTTDIAAWWLMPLAVIGLLAVSLRRAR